MCNRSWFELKGSSSAPFLQFQNRVTTQKFDPVPGAFEKYFNRRAWAQSVGWQPCLSFPKRHLNQAVFEKAFLAPQVQ